MPGISLGSADFVHKIQLIVLENLFIFLTNYFPIFWLTKWLESNVALGQTEVLLESCSQWHQGKTDQSVVPNQTCNIRLTNQPRSQGTTREEKGRGPGNEVADKQHFHLTLMMTSAQVVENVSHCHRQQSYSGLPSPGRSHYTIDCHSRVQTLYCIEVCMQESSNYL